MSCRGPCARTVISANPAPSHPALPWPTLQLIRTVAKINGDRLEPFTFRPRRLLDSAAGGGGAAYQAEGAGAGAADDHNSIVTASTQNTGAREFRDLSKGAAWCTLPRRVGRELLALYARFVDLFRGELRDKSILLVFLWATKGACYYGGILFMDRLYEIPTTNSVCDFQYSKIIINSTSELVGVVLLLPIIDSLGRVQTLLWTNVLGIVALVLMLCNISPDVTLICAWFMRLSFSSSTATLVISTLEMYTTKYRVTAFAFFFFLSRVGTVLSTLAVANSSFSNQMIEALFLLFVVMQSVVLLYMKETKDAALDSEF